MLTDMKRRAREQGADENLLAELQRVAVEDVIKGMDINPVSLQLAAAQLTAGNKDVRYRKMGLHLMPYGPNQYDPSQVSAGTLELLGQKAIVSRDWELDIPDNAIGSHRIRMQDDDVELEDAVDAAKDARIVIMNPPFTNRAKMGEKFPKGTQKNLHARVDTMERHLVNNDKDMDDFVDKNALAPLFVALADRCLDEQSGVLTMIHPTIALSNTSGQHERRILAQRYHIHTIVTCHQPRNINLSQNTNINESVIVMKRHNGPKPPTRFISLDRFPTDESEVNDLHHLLLQCSQGVIENGWGEVSEWPAEKMMDGDWTPAIWRSREIAESAAWFANNGNLQTMKQTGLSPRQTGREIYGPYERAEANFPGSFPVVKTKGAEGQSRIQSWPDEHWIPKNRNEDIRRANGGTYPDTDKILKKAGYLLVTEGQDNSTARLTAVASDERFIGGGWMPIAELSPGEAKALAVFINSTAGRIQLMRNQGRKITFPTYRPAGYANIRIPNVNDQRIRQILADCWERTKDMVVPQFRDGECEVRRLWDEAVAEAMNWDADELTRLRQLLHNEPHVRGLGYGQYADEVEE